MNPTSVSGLMLERTTKATNLGYTGLARTLPAALAAAAKKSTSQKVAVGIIGTVIALAVLAFLVWWIGTTFKVIWLILKDDWRKWVAAWVGVALVSTLILAAITPGFAGALELGLILASILVGGVLLLLGLFGAR